jgi:SnoaL-like domain
MNAIEELLETEAIRKLRVLYSHYFDGRRLDDLVSIFTDDAICEFGPDYGGNWVGKAQIRTNYSAYTGPDAPTFSTLHAVTNHLVTITSPTTAQGRCYLMDLNTTEGIDNPLILFGVYDDVYLKVNGDWKIHRTRIDFLWPKRNVLPPRQS